MKTRAMRLRPALESLEGRALLTTTPGTLDPSFGGTGALTTEVGSPDTDPNNNSATGVAVQADGKTIAVGTGVRYDSGAYHPDIVVVRYNADGSPDASFGSNGFVYIPSNGGTTLNLNPHGISVTIEGSGSTEKIVVAGTTINTYGKGKSAVQRTDLLIARLNANGSYDKSFNGSGQEVLDIAGENLLGAGGMVVQPDGKIVVAAAGNGGTGFGLMAVRVDANGGLDSTFGPSGRGYASIATSSFAQSIALDSHGNILVGGEAPGPVSGANPATLVRYTPSGLLDTSFGSGGEVQLGSTETGSVYGIAFQSTGEIVVSASITYPSQPTRDMYTEVARLNSSGATDTAFVVPSSSRSYGLTVEPNDEIVVAGMANGYPGPSTGFLVSRITADGLSLDPSFGNGGQAVVSFGAGTGATPSAVACGPDGELTVVGEVTVTSGTTNHYEFGAARLYA